MCFSTGDTVAFLKKALQKTLIMGLAEVCKAKGGAKAEICFDRGTEGAQA